MNDLKLCDFIPKKEKPKLNFPIRSTTANANKIQSNKYPTVVRIRNNSSSYNQVNRNINYSKIVTKNSNLENSSPKKVRFLPTMIRYEKNAFTEANEDKTKKVISITSPNMINDEDKGDEKMRDENEVKKLNMWEQDHYIADNLLNINNIDSDRSRISDSRTESINFSNQVKEGKGKRKLKPSNSILKDFNMRKDEDQGTIILQNIKHSKKKFDFNIFKKLPNVEEDINFKSVSKRVDKNLSSEDIGIDVINDKLFKDNDIKINHLGSKIDIIRSVDRYREIIKCKVKIENSHRLDMMGISQKIYDKKIDKSNISIFISECSNKLSIMQNNYSRQKEIFENHKKQLEDAFQQYIQEESFDGKKQNNQNNKGKVVISAMSNEFLLIQFEFERQIKTFDEKIKDLDMKFNSEKTKLSAKLIKNKTLFKSIEKEVKSLKQTFNKMTQEQRVYYLDILKRGIDVRSEGLVWVIKKLIELNTIIDYSMLPKFLDHEQIDYLLKLAHKQIESIQFKIMLKTLKAKQNKLKEEENSDLRNTKSTFFNATNTSNFLFKNMNDGRVNYKIAFSNVTVDNFSLLFQKYDKMMKSTYIDKIEDLNIQNVVDEIKAQIKNKPSNNNNDYTNQSKNNKHFNIITKDKEYFEEILLLRQKIEEIDNLCVKMKEEMLTKFRNKFEIIKQNCPKPSLQFDLIYSALFGNSIII